MSRRVVPTVLLLACLVASLAGCGTAPESHGPRYRSAAPVTDAPEYAFAIHPLFNPAKLIGAYQPLIDYLNAHLDGARLSLKASRDYAEFERKYEAREPAFLLPNPWETLQAIDVGYHVIAMAGDPQDFKGLIIIRKDSPVQVPADLKGKAVSYPSPTALAACIMPQYFLSQHGLNVMTDIQNRYVGSQDSAIMNVYLGLTAAGATWPPPWRLFQREHPSEAAELKVMWETPPLVNNSIMVRDDVPPAIADRVRSLLAGLDETPEGKAILEGMATAFIRPASDDDYDVVPDYVATFEREVRPVAGS